MSKTHEQTFFMCKVDYDYHLTDDSKGARVYSDLEALKRNRPCVEECGIVEVEVKLVRVVQESNYSRVKEDDAPSSPATE